MPQRLLVTGSSGLIGSEVCEYFAALGFEIHGIDNNQRAVFFGPQGDTRWNQERLAKTLAGFVHHELDIRNRAGVLSLVQSIKPNLIVHAAAQPSHERATTIPFDDFEINAVGTLNMLEAARQYCPETPFVHMSTNKVYGDGPNHLRLVELETRWEFAEHEQRYGIAETFSIDQVTHSLFGASKLSADILAQEYGRYLGLPTCVLRGGCLTGPHHSGVELHGFLSYLVKCNLEQREYRINGYKGKQVRDNIHSEDVARFIHCFYERPQAGVVYNLGGGRENSCSILEAFTLVERFTGIPMKYSYSDAHRVGDHMVYYSDLRKICRDYPKWSITKNLEVIFREIIESLSTRP
jgi:CDP-paratose 2-epimerase